MVLLITLGLLVPVVGGLLIGWELRAVRARKAEEALSEMQRFMMVNGIESYGHACFEQGVKVGRSLGRDEMAVKAIHMGIAFVTAAEAKQPRFGNN